MIWRRAQVSNPSRKTWYEEFEIDKKPFNGTYHNMDIDKCPVLELPPPVIGDSRERHATCRILKGAACTVMSKVKKS